jgi:Tol biopolymer transport system component
MVISAGSSLFGCRAGSLEGGLSPSEPVPRSRGEHIAFIAPIRAGDLRNDGLYVMRADGSDVRLLDENVTPRLDWSPDARLIAYSHASGAQEGIYVAELATGQTTRLTQTESWDGEPAWSPDGKSIAYVHDHENVCVVDWGARSRRTLNRRNGRVSNLAWSPDSKNLYFRGEDTSTARAFADVITSDWHLYRVDVGTGQQQKLWTHDGLLALPSPDGSRLAAVLDHEGARHLYLTDPRTLALERLELPGFSPEHVVWSPDGRRLLAEVVPADEDETTGLEGAGLLLVEVAPRKISPLVESGVEWGTVSWSPDESRIAFEREGDMVVLDVGTRQAKVVRPGRAPKWSP